MSGDNFGELLQFLLGESPGRRIRICRACQGFSHRGSQQVGLDDLGGVELAGTVDAGTGRNQDERVEAWSCRIPRFSNDSLRSGASAGSGGRMGSPRPLRSSSNPEFSYFGMTAFSSNDAHDRRPNAQPADEGPYLGVRVDALVMPHRSTPGTSGCSREEAWSPLPVEKASTGSKCTSTEMHSRCWTGKTLSTPRVSAHIRTARSPWTLCAPHRRRQSP